MGNFDRSKVFSAIFKMEVTSWLSLLLAVITFATPASTEPRVVCYYTNWSVYRPGTARFNPQNINPYLCTHLVYAFGGFTKDNTLKPFDKYQDIEKGGYAKFTGLKTYNKNLKTLLAIGGWNEGSTRFSPMVASRERRKEFVRNAIKFLRQNHFDGLDLDWEYPAFRDGGKPKDRENYAKLVKELREEFERESEKTGKPRLLLTMAVPAGIEYIQKGFDVRTLNRYLDWMNLLTYDYHSAFEPAVNHHAPLFPLEEPNEYSVDNELNIDYTIKFYLENGADRDKLVLGIPTYGRSYTLFNPDAVEIGAPADGPGEQGDATREKGYLAYYEICEALKAKKTKRSTDSDEEEDEDSSSTEVDEPWTVVYPNKEAMGPVAYRGNQWVGYDDIDIVQRKAEYVADNGLGGIMFWSIDNDDFRGTCHDKPYPLIEAAKEAYISKLGSTHNAVVSERPQSSSNRRRPKPKVTTTTTTARPSTADKSKINNRKSAAVVKSTTPTWNIVTPEPPTTPDPGSDFKCKDEGFFPHPRDCKKYFWCLDSGPSNLGIVAHAFTCPSGLFFNKAADSCDFARNVLCKKPAATTTTKAPVTKAPSTTTSTTRRPVKISTKSSVLFRTTTTTTTTPEPEEEYEEEVVDSLDVDAEDPKVIKELIDLIKKVGGVEQLEKQLHLSESSSTDGAITTTPSPFNKNLYKKVLERTIGRKQSNSILDTASQNSRQRGPQNAGLAASSDKDKLLRKDRPQYTTINRARASPTTEEPVSEDSEEEQDVEVRQPLNRARAVDSERTATTAKPLQYVNIRRARPSVSTSDTADDTASRNALFERPASYVTVSETPNTLDIQSARRENMPDYVTIRRQRPTTEEATTVQYQNTVREEESQETILEKEISSSVSQPQYTSIVRVRSTTSSPEEPESPEPTTVLSVQLSSLLNSHDSEVNSPESDATSIQTTEVTEPSTTTTSTTTTAAPSSLPSPTRRTILRRRGSTTTTTAAPSTTTQTAKERRKPFLRRTKATAAPDATDTETDSIDTETTTNKYTRRGNSKFKTRKEFTRKESRKNEIERPALSGGAARSERPRTFVRRRLGGANATSTSTATQSPSPSSPVPSSTAAPTTRRPFRVTSRRRLISSTTGKPGSTTGVASEEIPDIGDTDSIEDPALLPLATPKNSTKIQRRPLVTLKDGARDQNPSATTEEERKRQSKKYSASIKQNQLDEVIKQKKSQEDDTTTNGSTLAEDYSAETAVAIAAHQLLAAPVPSIPNYDEDSKPTKKSSPQTTSEYSYTSPLYTDFTESKTVYSEEFSSTPNYESSSLRNRDYIQTSTGTAYNEATFPKTTGFNAPKTTFSSTPGSYLPGISRAPLSTPSVLSQGLSGVSQNLGPSTARYLGSSNKYVSVPVEEFGYSTSGYTGISNEPAYFTREYLLESPVTKTYDDEYQYLSPATTPQTRKVSKKTVQRKISTTLAPTTSVPLSTTQPPRRSKRPFQKIPFEKVPFEKNQKPSPNKYRPIDNYDYYDDGAERVAEKYSEGTKVVLHGKGAIECLDIGNFPHPSSCKKFISCARIENGSLLGWEYICPKGLSFDPVGGICNWSAGLGCDEKDL